MKMYFEYMYKKIKVEGVPQEMEFGTSIEGWTGKRKGCSILVSGVPCMRVERQRAQVFEDEGGESGEGERGGEYRLNRFSYGLSTGCLKSI